ncbi:MAG: caspase family protein [Fibrobacter sp.]|nr:caspase family protein [Fibrobacter sp.]
MKKLIEKLDASMTIMALSLAALFFLAAASNASAAQGDNRISRYVIAVSANYGGEGRPMLRYAESDAKSFANVLREMGGVQAQNVIVVKEPGVAGLQKQLDGLDSKVSQNKNSGGRNEVLFYYSGHADEKGLRLGNEIYAWKELRKRIDALNADVKIAVIDACGSGAITRLKGGVAVPAFMVDQSSDMKGYAFITSSTQDESSQESDKLKGSFFTHSLVSGMRGAGDLSGDGKVTLSEAYQFAFNETLQKTETTMGGAQHPSRDMNLAGTGDVVMTDLRSTSAGLELDEDVDGRLFIRDDKGVLVAELYKKGGRSMSLGFPAGRYNVRLERPAEYKEASVVLQDNYRARLSQKQFAMLSTEKTTLRGEIGGKGDCASGDTIACSIDSLDHNGKYRMTFNLVDVDKEPRKGMQFGLFAAATHDYMLGSQVSLFANGAKREIHGIQLTMGLNAAKDRIEGVQASSMINYAGSIEGLQLGGVNVVRHASKGLQIGSTLNFAESFNGTQIASSLNATLKKSSGVQVSGAANFAADTVEGAQVSAAFNYAKQTEVQVTAAMNIAQESDVQVSAAMNIAKKSEVQVTAAMNIADETDVQVSAAMNIADEVKGAQVSVMNIAGRAEGPQVGILNICGYCESTPVGLLSLVGNGVWSATASMNEMGALDIALRFGTAYFFTTFEGARLIEKGTGFKHFSDVYETGLGAGTQFGKYGSHFELEYMFLNARNGRLFKDDDESGFHHRVRLGYTSQFVPFVGLSVGGTINVASAGYGDDIYVKPLGKYHDDFGSEKHKARWWPGFYAGVTVGRF